MNKRAQALIISLWILIILTIITVSIGSRVSLSLKLTAKQRDKLKGQYLARAALNLAAVMLDLDKDNNAYDSLNEAWANNEAGFRKIEFPDLSNGFASISYIWEEDEVKKTIYGIVDEQRKININYADKELLMALFDDCEITNSEALADNLLIWRGSKTDDNKIYEGLGYACKAALFSNIEELSLVKGITAEDFLKLKDIVTIYGADDKINLNTAPKQVILIFTKYIAKKITADEAVAVSLTGKIIDARNTAMFFLDGNDLKTKIVSLDPEGETDILNTLLLKATFQSNYFLIASSGNTGRINTEIKAAYNRASKKFVYWHES